MATVEEIAALLKAQEERLEARMDKMQLELQTQRLPHFSAKTCQVLKEARFVAVMCRMLPHIYGHRAISQPDTPHACP